MRKGTTRTGKFFIPIPFIILLLIAVFTWASKIHSEAEKLKAENWQPMNSQECPQGNGITIHDDRIIVDKSVFFCTPLQVDLKNVIPKICIEDRGRIIKPTEETVSIANFSVDWRKLSKDWQIITTKK